MKKWICKILGHRWFPDRLVFSPEQFGIEYPDTLWGKCRRCGCEQAVYVSPATGEVCW